jgi:Xaa-Pro aminopeptidase
MDPDLSGLDDYLDERGVEGYLIHADAGDSDQYYLAGFAAPDPFVTLYDGAVHLLFTRSLEYGRATREANADSVHRASEFGYRDLREEHGSRTAFARVLAAFLRSHGVESVATAPRFPLATADGVREEGIEVTSDDDGVVEQIRARKTEAEIDHIGTTQAANEVAMERARELLAAATIDGNGRLRQDDGVLTSERVKEEIEVTLLRNGCALDETIVACGADAADPHERGSGPLRAGESIIVDIFPRNKRTRYHGDMTRTFCVGEPSRTLREWYDLTERAYRAALGTVQAGVTGATVHDAACGVYESAGFPTLRSDENAETGFIHSTGHGVGLAVHERPSVGPEGGELEPGNVISIEPGLYDPAVGGVRLEDLVVVTEAGYENLTDYPMVLTV